MADVSDRVALPIQVHEFLLTCAGRIDDDALTDTRELLAVAELDRAVELLAGSLVAGRIPITSDEREVLARLVGAVRSAASLLDRIVVDDSARLPRHRFTVGAESDPNPDDGIAEAVGHVVEVLPDIRSVSCVWRTTPAGATSGPVPQRMVLVETGPDGFAPSTAYRVEQALRRSGISATVEVVASGGELTDYHRGALTAARRVTLRQGSPAPRPAEPVEPLFAESPAPRPVTSTRRRAAAAPVVDKRLPSETASGRWQQRIAAAKSEETPVADSPVGSSPSMSVEPPPLPSPAPTASSSETSRPGMTPVSVSSTEVTAATSRNPHQAGTPSSVSSTELSDHRPAIAEEATTAATVKPPANDAELSQREQELLRQLHEELAKREAPEVAGVAELPGVAERPAWQVDRSGQRHGAFPAVDYGAGSWQAGQDQTAVNGLPPYGGTPGGTGR
ncbi:MAG TPA: hypothetical protein VHX38_27270 [Pseudonocardiaceae bacterium]|jgi:hypothetical protein|nr:hypothetical protein [Pseudonocardiaceae bacterium]